MTPWVTVETLEPGAESVATVAGEKRGFASLHRIVQRLLSRTPALYDSITTHGVISVIRSAHHRAETVDREIPTATGTNRLTAVPVLGPTGKAHAVRFRLGRDDEQPEPRPAVGAIWDLHSQTIAQPGAPTVSIAELFQHATVVEQHNDVLRLLYDPEPGAKRQFDVTIANPAAKPAQWRITLRARDDDTTCGAWWLIEDVTSDDAPPPLPTLEQVALREAHRRAGTHLAVVQLSHSSIAHWLTDPPPWIQWDGLAQPIDAFHLADRAGIIGAADRIRRDETVELTIRTLAHDGTHTPTTLHLFPYPDSPNANLVIAQFAIKDAWTG